MNNDKLRMPFLLDLYEQYLENQDSAAFAGKAAEWYTTGTLQRLAGHRRREIRRAAVLAIGFLGDYAANACLGRALLDEDRTVRTLADHAIRSVWLRDGSDEERQRLGLILRLSAARRYAEAVARATDLIEKAPWFAEAWNQRAIAQFNLERFAESIRDGHEVLEINPYHFPAAASMGQAYLELGNQVSALESFRRAQRLNPDLEGVRAHVVRLARIVEGKGQS